MDREGSGRHAPLETSIFDDGLHDLHGAQHGRDGRGSGQTTPGGEYRH